MKRILTAFALILGLGTAALAEDAAPQIVEMIEGNPEAKVQVIEYASLTCPHCASFHANQYKKLREAYIDSGKIQFTFREIYFDRPGLWGSMIARCGGELRFAGIIERMFEKQSDWARAGDGAAILGKLRDIGRAAGLTAEQLDQCVTDNDKAQALVAWSTANAEADKVNATPTVVINGTTYPNQSFKDLAKLIDEALAAN